MSDSSSDSEPDEQGGVEQTQEEGKYKTFGELYQITGPSQERIASFSKIVFPYEAVANPNIRIETTLSRGHHFIVHKGQDAIKGFDPIVRKDWQRDVALYLGVPVPRPKKVKIYFTGHVDGTGNLTTKSLERLKKRVRREWEST